jgi:hypothetical protein
MELKYPTWALEFSSRITRYSLTKGLDICQALEAGCVHFTINTIHQGRTLGKNFLLLLLQAVKVDSVGSARDN